MYKNHVVYKNIHGVDLDVDGDMVVLSDKRHGAFEKETFDYLEKVIYILSKYHSRPLVFADIGAYTGIYSIYAAMKGMVVEAFEPHPLVHDRLRANIDHNNEKFGVDGRLNGVIHCHQCAISDSARDVLLHHNNIVRLTSGGSVVSLPCYPTVDIDDIRVANTYDYKIIADTYNLKFYKRPDIVKIDVEGHELSVLRGMECLDDNLYKPVMIVETNHYDKYTEVMEYLTERDYNFVGMFDGRNMIFEPRMLQFVNE